MSAVDEHRELHCARAAELVQRVERGAGGAAGEQHVVDQHDDLPGDVGDLGGPERRDGPQPDVVAVEGDVEHADRGLDVLERGDRGRDPAGEGDAAGVEADEDDVVGAVVALDDLVRDPGQRPAEVGGVEDVRAKDRAGRRGAERITR